MMLTKAELSQFATKLSKEKERISAELAGLRDQQSEEPLRDSVGELSAYDQHTSDLGNETFEREKDIGLADNLKIILSQIEEAEERIDQGNYGICSVCGGEISRERLMALPYATTCPEHADDEFDATTEGWPVEEELLYPPFGRTFTDDAENENMAFDGEDTWQALAKFGNANSPQDVPDAIGYDEVYVDADENVGIVEDVEGIMDVTEGEEDQNRIIFPDPSTNLQRKPHKLRRRHGRG